MDSTLGTKFLISWAILNRKPTNGNDLRKLGKNIYNIEISDFFWFKLKVFTFSFFLCRILDSCCRIPHWYKICQGSCSTYFTIWEKSLGVRKNFPIFRPPFQNFFSENLTETYSFLIEMKKISNESIIFISKIILFWSLSRTYFSDSKILD